MNIIKSLILNKDNSISELDESETKFIESVEQYMGNNMERVANMPTYEKNERARRGKFVCSQLEMLAIKGKELYSTEVEETDKELNTIMGEEVEKFNFMDEVKKGLNFAGLGTWLGKTLVVCAICLLVVWGGSKIMSVNEVNADTGTVSTQGVNDPKAPSA